MRLRTIVASALLTCSFLLGDEPSVLKLKAGVYIDKSGESDCTLALTKRKLTDGKWRVGLFEESECSLSSAHLYLYCAEDSSINCQNESSTITMDLVTNHYFILDDDGTLLKMERKIEDVVNVGRYCNTEDVCKQALPHMAFEECLDKGYTGTPSELSLGCQPLTTGDWKFICNGYYRCNE